MKLHSARIELGPIYDIQAIPRGLRPKLESLEGYNLTLPLVVFRGNYIYSSYYRRFLTKMQGGYHDTLQ